MRCISLKTILYGRQSLPSCDCFGGEVASVKTYFGGWSSRSSRSSIPLKTTLWSAFTYAVLLLCLCEIVPLKSYLGAGAAVAVFSHTALKPLHACCAQHWTNQAVNLSCICP